MNRLAGKAQNELFMNYMDPSRADYYDEDQRDYLLQREFDGEPDEDIEFIDEPKQKFEPKRRYYNNTNTQKPVAQPNNNTTNNATNNTTNNAQPNSNATNNAQQVTEHMYVFDENGNKVPFSLTGTPGEKYWPRGAQHKGDMNWLAAHPGEFPDTRERYKRMVQERIMDLPNDIELEDLDGEYKDEVFEYCRDAYYNENDSQQQLKRQREQRRETLQQDKMYKNELKDKENSMQKRQYLLDKQKAKEEARQANASMRGNRIIASILNFYNRSK